MITFDPQKQDPPRTGAIAFDGIELQPGENDLDPSKILNHPDFADLVACGAIVVQEAKDGQSIPPKRNTRSKNPGNDDN